MWAAGLRFISSLLFGCCTVLVVPMANTIAQVFSCQKAEGRSMLDVAPNVECFVGAHLHLTIVIFVMAPVYIFLLFPYALVKGDADYVQRDELWRPKAWQQNARRKATVLHLGPMHPEASNIFVMVCSEIACKIVLPIAAKLTQTDPVLQMTLIVPLGFCMLAVTYFRRPLIDEFWNLILQGSRVWTCCAMVCAFLVAWRPHSYEPAYLLAICSIVVPACTVHKARSVECLLDHKQVLRLRTIGAITLPLQAALPEV